MDVLADVLAVLDVRASLYFRATFSAPFAVAVPADHRRIRFHLGCRGESWIGLSSGESAAYGPGDLILVPHGASHTLADEPTTPALPLDDVLKQASSDRIGCISYGGRGRIVELVCGHFGFNEDIAHPLVESLPPLIHIKAREQQDYSWLDVVLRQMEKESCAALPGHQEALRRLSEILFIQVLRTFVEEGSASARFLTVLVDPQLRGVLDAIHADPSSDWTVERLGEIAGLSRTIFAERFREKLGVTPMRYLADWRLQKARALLSEPSLTIGEIARAIGYDSEASFNRAFSQHFGKTPGTVRKGTDGKATEGMALWSIALKRIYEPATKTDGFRVLVDRLWPRGVSKADARIDLWLRDIGPSKALRQWFNHDPARWKMFCSRYQDELREKTELLMSLKEQARRGRVTLLYSTRDERFNQAVVLRNFLRTTGNRSASIPTKPPRQ